MPQWEERLMVGDFSQDKNMNIGDFLNNPINMEARTSTPSMLESYNKPTMFPIKASPKPAAAPAQYKIKDRGVSVTDKDMDAIRPLIYGEVSNRTPDKQTLEANVIFNTALNRMKEYQRKGQNKSLEEVISMPKQYQAYGGPQYQEYHAPSNPVSSAKRQQIDAIIDGIKEKVKKGEHVDNTEGAYYYIHEKDGKIRYDNKRKLFAD
jgi:hypothetical protein